MSPLILIVEDDDDDAFFLQRGLREAGLVNPVHRVADGQQAMDYLAGSGVYQDRSQYPLPSLMLLDLQLPLRSGFEVLQWVRSQPALQKLIVVVLTASGVSKDIALAYDWGARSYLVKPPTPADLKELMESLKSAWIGLEEIFRLSAARPRP